MAVASALFIPLAVYPHFPPSNVREPKKTLQQSFCSYNQTLPVLVQLKEPGTTPQHFQIMDFAACNPPAGGSQAAWGTGTAEILGGSEILTRASLKSGDYGD